MQQVLKLRMLASENPVSSAERLAGKFVTLPAQATPCSACSRLRLPPAPRSAMPPCLQTPQLASLLENLVPPASPFPNSLTRSRICSANCDADRRVYCRVRLSALQQSKSSS